MIRFAKYNDCSGIDIYYDNSYRFPLKWDAREALSNRTERLYRDLTKDFDTGYSGNRARLAAQHYKSELNKYGIQVDLEDLRYKLTMMICPYAGEIYKMSLPKIRDHSVISKGGSEGYYKYELPMGLVEEYKRLYYKLINEYYDEIYGYITNTYGK